MQKNERNKLHKIRYYSILASIFVIFTATVIAVYKHHNCITCWLKNKINKTESLFQTSSINNTSESIDVAENPITTAAQVYQSAQNNRISPQATKELAITSCTDFNYNYKKYLFNVQMMLASFMQDKPYSSELEQLTITSLPKELNDLLLDFAQYNKDYLITAGDQRDYEQIFPKQSSFLAKLIKVKEKTRYGKDKETLRTKIIFSLARFTDLVYAEEMQHILSGK